MRTLGERLKHARVKKRYTQIQVAKKLDISNGAISGYERDYRDPDTVTLKKLADLYEVTPNWLLGKEEQDSADLFLDYLEMELTDEEIIERMTFKIDNMILDEDDVKEFIAFVRAKRFMKTQQSGSSNTDKR
ncbi:helix-turn-helix domain-containing protein [Paenibacillus harenae]|uniref:helix-turn-helix domain-containing protein n=1 Tax=Paenibacillus harenae TaxID=306543 RepID=UPI000688B0FE|nr:helix-turn-helix transcriptional regulator [Paenibacillus harenae]